MLRIFQLFPPIENFAHFSTRLKNALFSNLAQISTSPSLSLYGGELGGLFHNMNIGGDEVLLALLISAKNASEQEVSRCRRPAKNLVFRGFLVCLAPSTISRSSASERGARGAVELIGPENQIFIEFLDPYSGHC